MVTVGIDIGFNGGIAFNRDGKITALHTMPTNALIGWKTKKGNFKKRQVLDILSLKSILSGLNCDDDLVVFEKLQGMPDQSSVATFCFGEQYGIIQGLLVGLGLRYVVIRPQEWKREILKGYNTKDKGSSVLYVQRKYPNVNLLKTNRSRKPHDGMADAICLAEYGMLRLTPEPMVNLADKE